jgi:hypothetical protein
MHLILPLPSRWTVLPLLVHTINATKHSREAYICIDRQQLGCVRSIWLSTPGQWRKACGLTHADILINKITGNPVCKHPNSCSAFLIRGEANLSKGFLLAWEIIIIRHHSLLNTVEHMSRHPEAAPEKLGIEEWGRALKVIDEE